jgi:hypothetical protein
VPVIDLKPGDRLQSLSDGAGENTSSEVESLELYAPEGQTYNLTVDIGHTFYVGKLRTWVHNEGPCALPERGGVEGPKATGAALESEATGFFGQQRKYWSQEPIQFNGNKVYQRNDLVDPSRVDSQTGLTNLDLMKNGLAPYGPDGKKVNLHHMLQTQDGPIAEVTQSFHQKNSGAIHINSGSDIPSGINRSQFEKWKKDYWRSRANNF